MHDDDLAGAGVLARSPDDEVHLVVAGDLCHGDRRPEPVALLRYLPEGLLRDRQAARSAVGPVRGAVQDGDDPGVGDAADVLAGRSDDQVRQAVLVGVEPSVGPILRVTSLLVTPNMFVADNVNVNVPTARGTPLRVPSVRSLSAGVVASVSPVGNAPCVENVTGDDAGALKMWRYRVPTVPAAGAGPGAAGGAGIIDCGPQQLTRFSTLIAQV